MSDSTDSSPSKKELEERVSRLENQVDYLTQKLDDSSTSNSSSQATQTPQSTTSSNGETDDSSAESVESFTSEKTDKINSHISTVSSLVAGRGLAIAGIFTLLVATVFGIQIAIQQELIGYLGRVVIGILSGGVLAVGGWQIAEQTQYKTWGWIVSGGGFPIAYFSAYAAYGFEDYRNAIGVGFEPILLLMTLIAGAAIFLGIKKQNRYLTSESFLLAFVGAIIAGITTELMLLYGIIVTIGILIVSSKHDWPELSLGVFFSYIVYTAWFISHENLTLSILFLTVTYISYTVLATKQSRSVIQNGTNIYNTFFITVVGLFLIEESVTTDINAQALFLALIALTQAAFYLTKHINIEQNPTQYFTQTPITTLTNTIYYTFFTAIAISTYYSTFVGLAILTIITIYITHTDTSHARNLLVVSYIPVIGKIVYDYTTYGSLSLSEYTEPTVVYPLIILAILLYATYYVFTRQNITTQHDPHRTTAYLTTATLTAITIPLLLVGIPSSLINGFYALLFITYLTLGLYYDNKILRIHGLLITGYTFIRVFLVEITFTSLLVLGFLLLTASFVYKKYLPEDTRI